MPEESLVPDSNTKDDPSDPVYGPKQSSKGHHPEGLSAGPWKPPLYSRVGRAAIKNDRLVPVKSEEHESRSQAETRPRRAVGIGVGRAAAI